MTATTATSLPVKRVGLRHWLAAYRAMVRWEVTGARLVLPLLGIVQLLAGAGFVIGFGLLIPDIETTAALYLSTGAVVMTLVLLGMIVTPQIVAQHKMAGSYDYLQSLPVPRGAATLAMMTLAAMVAVPGVAAALLAAVWRYGIGFTASPLLAVALPLTLACGCLLGMAIAHGVAKPELTMLLSQLTIFFVIGFSPINFPIDRLPGWLGTAHEYLPIHHMALAVRSSLTDGLVEMTARSWTILAAWTVAAAGFTGAILGRRR